MDDNKTKIRLTTTYDFCASHVLTCAEWSEEQNKKIFGKCAHLHGHHYKMEITLEGQISNVTGMLINGFDVDRIVQEKILLQIDHRHINDDISFFKSHLPTAEWIATWVFGELKESFPPTCQLKRVRVYETPTLYAEYVG